MPPHSLQHRGSLLLEDALAIWHDCPATIPELHSAPTQSERLHREARFDEFLAAIQAEVHHPPLTRADRKSANERITAAFAAFGKNGLGLRDEHLELLLVGFSRIASDMARRARRFDPSVSFSDVFQANRNAWTACGLQVLFDRTMELTPSIFAYSMLYPYTDNYLDDPAVDKLAKKTFSERFGARLGGQPIRPANAYENTIWRLVELIESQLSREDAPEPFASLLLIHAAQDKSIRLLRNGASSGAVDVLRLSFEKGGTSVLADAYLAAGQLTPEQAQFVYNWGVFLQLADDLQDVVEDRRDGMTTLFTQAADRGPLDQLTSQTLAYGHIVMRMMGGLDSADGRVVKELIARSCMSLIVRCAGAVPELYTRAYLDRLEAYSPFRFAFLADRRRQMAKRSGMFERLFDAMLSGGDDEPAFPLLPGAFLPHPGPQPKSA